MQDFSYQTQDAVLGFHIQNTFGVFLDLEHLMLQHEFNQEEVDWHEDFSEKILNGQIDDRRIINEYFSKLRKIITPEHEIKHFHDLFITPLGAYVIIIDYQLLMNFNSLLNFYSVGADYKLELPINETIKKKIDTTDEQGKIVKWFDLRLTEINTLLTNTNSVFQITITTTDLIEASATLMEIQAIYKYFGQKTCDFYISTLLEINSRSTNVYTKILSLLYLELGITELNLMHKIVFYSLCGNFSENENAFPANRFCELVEYISSKKPDYTSAIEKFYIEKQYSNPEDALMESQKNMKKIIDQLENNKHKFAVNDIGKDSLYLFEHCKKYFERRNEVINNKAFMSTFLDLNNQIEDFFENLVPSVYFVGEKRKMKRKLYKRTIV